MVTESRNFVCIEKINLCNYGIFEGKNEFEFDRQTTVIAGYSNSGKSTMFNALRSLGPVTGVQPHIAARLQSMSVTVTISGDRELVNKYRDLIFIDGEAHEIALEGLLPGNLSKNQIIKIENEARNIFFTFTSTDKGSSASFMDLKYAQLNVRERVCLKYAFVFAARKILKLDVPAVFASPFGCIDYKLTASLNDFFDQQTCQQIYIIGTNQADRISPRCKIQYLMSGDNHGK